MSHSALTSSTHTHTHTHANALVVAVAEPKNVPGGTDVLGKCKSVPGKNQDPCFDFYMHIYALYIKIPFKLIVSDALRIAIKHECI